MNETNHFRIQTSSENGETNQIELNFRNIPEADAVQLLHGPIWDAIKGTMYAHKINQVQVYRKACTAEIEEVLRNIGFSKTQSQKWISENLPKVLKFQNNGVPEAVRTGQKILEINLDKSGYTNFRNESVIPQFESKGSGKSVYNFEGIPDGACQSQAASVPSIVDRNIGINKAHIDQFNENITSINVLDPEDPLVKNRYLRYLSENKVKLGMLALSVIVEAKDLILTLMDKSGQALEKLTLQITKITIDNVGSYIGTAIGSLMPGIGNFVVGFISGLVFGYIGRKLGEIIITLFPRVARGEGEPILQCFSFNYGCNKYFGEPISQYNFVKILAIPQICDSEAIQRAAHQQPTAKDEWGYIQAAFGRPK
ncbi:unnamed protein product [Adineta ricciae]|uniref:Uncharacterized protein n=1 Tax=Adineta ricciae TaxID=249248 RepID=A0A813MK02_ADIRI|nr:unnamed protein product [Adineta ricciae]CAF1650950.1 unnamed protein product [Adineta ricciae]